jgi:hypothetical protein
VTAVVEVHYRWVVDAERHALFVAGWHAETLAIRSSRAGALGSVLLASTADPRVIVATAFWDSVEAWEQSQAQGAAAQDSVAAMAASSELVSTEVFRVVDDASTGRQR